MDVYRQAAEVIKIVREGNGTAKALCLRKEMQKKKQTYAVVCETLRHYELLEDVLENAEFFKYYPQANREFALCMTYDVVLGKGVNTNNDTTARAVTQSASYLREAYWQVYKHHVIPPRNNERWEESAEGSGRKSGKDGASPVSTTGALQLPRYARVNTLKISVEELISRLRRAAAARKRTRDEDDGEDAVNSATTNERGTESGKRVTRRASSRPLRSLPEFTQDPIVPQLLVFPPGTDLHAHPAVRSGQLILQDRASCIPAAVLLDAVPVDVVCEKGDKAAPRKPLEYVVDACAAPGNKTTQLAALGAPHIKIMATERDERRAELLMKRVGSLGAADYINVVNIDFFQLSSDDRAATEAILLDPSCSASGVVTRVDIALQHHRNRQQKGKEKGTRDAGKGEAEANDAGRDGGATAVAGSSGAIDPETQENDFSINEDRVDKLARLQRKLLAHSLLSFDNCRTVVYSTCSVHEEEDEDVVRQVLDDERVQARGWTLSNIMPKEWKTRGIEKNGEKHPLRFTIRCDPVTDATNGFYVARFDRTLKS
ncbi:hypothetical protein ABL78_1425 [Leptomonas seymouri]|uniref:SAM-dependent MTase RsmB/NOP-type domain-containing protein n=1 Tax=Leptomonas seymouri TaxID=5684 RepID=A0A0N1I291_LEPSE|nr:hypothetical protein ABL78_1425 [Leptomonas seymouri]|eukprot:KPI89461.1 hypothetical protein ABL78_1425 [Leptomonas seymouri]